jgi:DNA ligase (NAD+)
LKGNFPPIFDVRGEIILPFAAFKKMNQDLIEIGETPYSQKYSFWEFKIAR